MIRGHEWNDNQKYRYNGASKCSGSLKWYVTDKDSLKISFVFVLVVNFIHICR